MGPDRLGGGGDHRVDSHLRVLVQPIESRAPLRPAAALGLFALGVAALAFDRGLRRTALVLATTGAAIGLTGLLELITGTSLGLDGLPLRPDLEALIGVPGSAQVPVSTAWGLIMGGAGIVAVVTGLKRPSGAFVIGVIASILGALGFALLLAQAIGFSPGRPVRPDRRLGTPGGDRTVCCLGSPWGRPPGLATGPPRPTPPGFLRPPASPVSPRCCSSGGP